MTILSDYAKISSYKVVHDSLTKLIESRKLAPGDRLPSEIKLAKQFGVSRPILREAYRLLERDGLIIVRGGAGTFLGSPVPVIKNPLNDLSSTGMLIRRAGFDADAEVKELTHREPEPEWAEKLSLAAGENVVVAKRLRRADSAAIALSWNIMPEQFVGNKFDNGIHESIFRHLELECEITVERALTSIYALNLEHPYDSEAKAVLGGMAILMKRLHFDAKGLPVLYSLDYMRTDLVELTIQQERKEY